jgi:benzoyl-CoA reductase subunit C
MTIEQLVSTLEPRLKRPWEDPVREWKEQNPGGKVVGCFPVYSPVELVDAARALPVGLFGAGNQIEIQHADARFVSFVCSIAKSTLELGLQGRLKEFDALLFHSICDVARNLASVVQRNVPHAMVEYIHLPQNPSSPAAVEYLKAEYQRVAKKLGDLTGHPATEAALETSIALYNACRHALSELYALRSQEPDRLSTVELYHLTRSMTFMPPERCSRMLHDVREMLDARAVVPRDRIRVVIEGSFCEQPPLDLIRSIEEAGCHVVDDDFMKGWRWFRKPVDVRGDPFEALARAYLDASDYSSVRHDWRTPKEKALVQKVRRHRADAVVFCIAKFCEPALFDYVLFKQELERENIPHLLIEFEEKMWTFQRARDEIETFVESILFR